jgi:pSer/pThr/pTyr-binding forkhead associated (FHA) protein
MEVKLKVLVGPNAGKEVSVVGPKFLVGRAEDCQLRPRSDLISRHHCVLMIEDALLIVRDFGSKNGTLVNGERVIGERELAVGDRLQIGPLDFEVCIRTGIASKKRPKVEGVKDAAARTAAGNAGGSAADMDDV